MPENVLVFPIRNQNKKIPGGAYENLSYFVKSENSLRLNIHKLIMPENHSGKIIIELVLKPMFKMISQNILKTSRKGRLM